MNDPVYMQILVTSRMCIVETRLYKNVKNLKTLHILYLTILTTLTFKCMIYLLKYFFLAQVQFDHTQINTFYYRRLE